MSVEEVVVEKVEDSLVDFPLFGPPLHGPPGGGEPVKEIDLTWLKDLEKVDEITNP
jgi:hypothetical protein